MLNPMMEQFWQLSWQAAAVAIFVLLLRAIFCRALTARWRHALWLMVLGRLIIPVLPESRFSLFSVFERFDREATAPILTAFPELNPIHTTVTIEYGPVEKSASTPVRNPQHKKSFWNISNSLETVWAMGACIILLRLIVTNARFASRLGRDSQLTSAGLVSMLDDCRKEMRMARSPGLIITDVVDSPAVIGILRPRILLPARSIQTVAEHQLRLIFLHELAHIKCRDVAMDWLWAIVQSLHWFNPILWMIAPLRRGDREQARDEMVLHITGPHQAKLYGQTLLNLSESSKQPIFSAGLVGILSRKRRLRRRIELIAAFAGSSNKATFFGAVLLMIAGCAVLTNPTSKKSDGSDPPSATPANTSSKNGTPETRHYDVNDLLFVAPDYNLRSAINTSELKMSNDQLWASRLHDLKTYIQDNVASSTWKEHGGNIGTIAYVPGGRELVIQQTPENHADIEIALNNLRRGRGLQISLATRILLIDEDDIQKLPPAIKQRLASLSGAGKYRTDQILSEDERKQIVSSLTTTKSTIGLTAPRLTLFNGQNSALTVATQQAYVDSLSNVTENKAGHSATSYEPHVASATATGLEFQCSVCASPDHNATFVESHLTLTRMIGLLTEHWPDAPANVEANVQRPIMVDYDRSITCAIPKQMTLLLAGFTQTINDARNPLLEKQAVGPALDKIKAADLSVEKERRMRVYLLLTPTILSNK